MTARLPKNTRQPATRARPQNDSARPNTTSATAVVAELKRRGSKKVRDGMARFAIPADRAFGISVGDLRRMAKQLGRDQYVARGHLDPFRCDRQFWWLLVPQPRDVRIRREEEQGRGGTWVDSANGFMSRYGGQREDETNTLEWTGQEIDPTTGELVEGKQIRNFLNSDTRTITSLQKPEGSDEFVKVVEMILRRQKTDAGHPGNRSRPDRQIPPACPTADSAFGAIPVRPPNQGKWAPAPWREA